MELERLRAENARLRQGQAQMIGCVAALASVVEACLDDLPAEGAAEGRTARLHVAFLQRAMPILRQQVDESRAQLAAHSAAAALPADSARTSAASSRGSSVAIETSELNWRSSAGGAPPPPPTPPPPETARVGEKGCESDLTSATTGASDAEAERGAGTPVSHGCEAAVHTAVVRTG